MTSGKTSDQTPGAIVVDAHHHLWNLRDRTTRSEGADEHPASGHATIPADHGYDWLDAPELAPIRRSFTADELRVELTAHGVHRTVLVEGGRCHPDEVAEHLAIAADTDEIAGVVAWADLTDPALPATLAGYRRLPGAGKLVGIRDQVQGRTDPDFLARPVARDGIAAVGAAGLAFDLVVRVDQLPAAAVAAAALPDVRFVLDHLGKPRIAAGAEGLAQWRAAITPLAACANVTCKLSGMVTEASLRAEHDTEASLRAEHDTEASLRAEHDTEASLPPGSRLAGRPAGQRFGTPSEHDTEVGWAQWTVDDLRPYVTTAVELFGADRVMFGSDWPVCTTVASYGRVLAALHEALPELSDADRDAVFGGTALRTYQLEV